MANVSVVVSTCNRYGSILDTLHSILNNTVKPCEVLIVDQSDDRRRMSGILRSIDTKLIKHICLDEKGLSRARNIGMKHSRGEIIAFTDDDAYVREDWIERTMETFGDARFRCGVAGGKIIPVYQERNPDWRIPSQFEYVLPAYTQEGPVSPYSKGYPPGVNYAILRELIGVIGYFDEQLGVTWGRKNQLFGEDTHYTLRAIAAGYQIVYNPESVVYHPVPMARQTQDFLNDRLFAKGLTDIAVRYRLVTPGRASMVIDYLRSVGQRIKFELKGSNDSRFREGQRALLRGQMAMIGAYIRHSDVFRSGLF